MSATKPSTPRLSEAARYLVYPSTIRTSVFPRVEAKLKAVGVEFDPWQRGFGTIALGLNESGKYAASIGGVVASIPRQVGKTFTVGHLLIGLCLSFPGLRVIWTSHHLQTTSNTFQSMQGMVRRKKIFVHVDEIRLVNGEQRIRFKNGSVIMFGARAMGFGRGMDKIDVEVFDEAQILPLRALEDMVPATNQAQHEHGALLFFIGTPPRPVDDGEAFASKRQQALAGNADDDMVYVEFSADKGASPDDRSQWPKMNPSYPTRTPLESMLRMRKNLPDDSAWRREAMGIWDDDARSPISADRWRACTGGGPEDGEAPASFGVAAHDGQISVVACWAFPDGGRYVEEVAGDTRLDAVKEWLEARVKRRTPLLVSNYGLVAPLAQMLRRHTVPAASTGDVAKGCELLVEGCEAGWLSHADQPQLAASIAGARPKYRSDGSQWTFDLKESSSNAPAMAMALALQGASGVKTRSGTDKKQGRVVVLS
ncbi:terminase [Gordonia paraffinivorans]|uniref:terminase n=1 Tax=Gordonia paraffinivorans TaxID=175628 RepID=UPI003FCC71A6